jgi:glycosyltransferase involved in cell wall biosynthesis
MNGVVHITEALGGGVLSMLTQLSNQAAAAGIEVTVIYSLRRETPKNFANLFHPTVKLIYVSMFREVNFKKDWTSLWELIKNLRHCNPAVVHLHSSKAGVLGRVAARIATPNAKVLYSPHGLSFLRRDVSPASKYAYLIFERMAERMGGTIVACSNSELKEIKEKVHARDVAMIENGVNVAEIPLRRARDDGKVVIGMSGRASFQKNHEAFASLANTMHSPTVTFLWIGGNMAEVPDPRRNLSISCTGWVSRTRALELMSELDIYVQTSRWEGLPLAVIEAQVAGIPAVVTDVVGNRDAVFHGVTGFVASSPDEMSRYVAILRDDSQLRKRMGAAARQSASIRFSMDVIFREWLAVYDLAMEKQLREAKDVNQVASCNVTREF